MSPTASYTVQYDTQALTELGKVDRPIARRIVSAVEELSVEPRPSQCRALTGYPGLLRIRVGDYRIVYTVRDSELVVLVLRVAHRSSIYRRL